MWIRRMTENDWNDLTTFYRAVVSQMTADKLAIWDEAYPVCCLEEDIENGRLYGLLDKDGIAAAFALCKEADGADTLGWNGNGRAMYLDRLAVRVSSRGRGIGARALLEARQLCRMHGAEWLRLFVVRENLPAIALYEKHGFFRAEGVFGLSAAGRGVLWEFGYEIRA